MPSLRWKLWECAMCGQEVRQLSITHDPPQCCGTTMWFQTFITGAEVRSFITGAEAARLQQRRSGDA